MHVSKEKEKNNFSHFFTKYRRYNPNTSSLENDLLSLRRQTVDLLHYKAKAPLQHCHKISYDSDNKCRKLLAKMVREDKATTYTPQIISPSGQNLKNGSTSRLTMDKYVAASQLPQFSSEIRKELDALITMEELQKTVGEMKPGKAPGPNGFTLQYYQTFLPKIGPYMVKLFNTLNSDTNLPNDTLRAYIYPLSLKKIKTRPPVVAVDLFPC